MKQETQTDAKISQIHRYTDNYLYLSVWLTTKSRLLLHAPSTYCNLCILIENLHIGQGVAAIWNWDCWAQLSCLLYNAHFFIMALRNSHARSGKSCGHHGNGNANANANDDDDHSEMAKILAVSFDNRLSDSPDSPRPICWLMKPNRFETNYWNHNRRRDHDI